MTPLQRLQARMRRRGLVLTVRDVQGHLVPLGAPSPRPRDVPATTGDATKASSSLQGPSRKPHVRWAAPAGPVAPQPEQAVLQLELERAARALMTLPLDTPGAALALRAAEARLERAAAACAARRE